MLAAIDDPPYGRRVPAQRRLFASGQVEPPYLPIHAAAEGLVVVRAEAHVQHGRAVLYRPDQRALLALGGGGGGGGLCVV